MSEKELLNIKDLVVDVEEKEILHGGQSYDSSGRNPRTDGTERNR